MPTLALQKYSICVFCAPSWLKNIRETSFRLSCAVCSGFANLVSMKPYLILAGLLTVTACRAAETVWLYDFTQGTHGWAPAHAVDHFESTREGLEFDCIANDPYITSPPVKDMPLGHRVMLTLRMKSDGDGGGQIFYGREFTAEQMVSFPLPPQPYSEQRTGTRPIGSGSPSNGADWSTARRCTILPKPIPKTPPSGTSSPAASPDRACSKLSRSAIKSSKACCPTISTSKHRRATAPPSAPAPCRPTWRRPTAPRPSTMPGGWALNINRRPR